MNKAQIRQEIIECLAELSDEQLLQLRELIKQTFMPKTQTISEEERKKLIHSLRGKYAHIPTSSEDFAQRKQKEIDWENRNK